jgi:hypothetical protein
VPKVAPHHKRMETSISFDTSNCPKNMARARQLSLLVSPTITNIRLYHVLVVGGTTLNLISLAAFEKLQIPMSSLAPSRLFSRVGLGSIIPCSSISLPMIFGMPENYCMESIVFDVTEVNLPFNDILGRPALYQFMNVAHYGYLVLKMSSPNGIIKLRETAPSTFLCWRSSRRWRRPMRLLLAMAVRTRRPRVHVSMAQHLHPMCSPRKMRTSP